ncbi:hypothetical protein HOY82DRAFT_610023 [Tuber indicum]|nr:hypothetical protein HOY82DRAFT_610023 [Tuber indicum]
MSGEEEVERIPQRASQVDYGLGPGVITIADGEATGEAGVVGDGIEVAENSGTGGSRYSQTSQSEKRAVPRTKLKGKGEMAPINWMKGQMPFTIQDALTNEAEDNIECLYVEAWMGHMQLPGVLVDAGAMLDLISSQLIDKLRLRRFPVSGLGMRLADDRLVVLKNYVWLDVVVAGVLARIKAYEVAVSETYQLLLSRRWLKRVRAVAYHDSRTLFIEGSDRIR